ncbi:hypothetical protein ABKN59_011855 [Abortiporus biennis]
MSSQQTTSLSYPPSAHRESSEQSSTDQCTSAQPAPAPQMSLNPSSDNDQSKAERLRGGCIPCPDGSICYIIPIPCFCC